MSRPGDKFFATPEDEKAKPEEVDHYERHRFVRRIAVAFIGQGLEPSTIGSSVRRVLKSLDEIDELPEDDI